MAIKISGTTVIPDTLGSANQVLRINSGGTEGEWGDASGGVTYLSKTANYTASANEGILSDTSGGAFTVTLPASPSEGDVVIINDAAGSWNTNNLTVERNGSTIDGDAENMTLDVDNASVEFIYNGTTWGVYAGAGLGASSATYDKTEFTATAGQTSFTVDYKVGFVDVYLNGVKLAASDYTATNETSVVLVEAAALNDIFEVIAWNVFSIADAVMDSELTDIAAVKALNQGVATTDSPTFAALTTTGTVTANRFVGSGAIILVSGLSDATNYSTTSNSYQTAARVQITPSTSTSRLMGWFYCQMRAVGTVSDGDMGNTARVYYLNSSGSWASASNVAQNLRTENGTSTGSQEIAVTFPVLFDQGDLNPSGDWDVAIRHYEIYDATSEIDDGKFYYMEYEP
jgi:hypothetical protein